MKSARAARMPYGAWPRGLGGAWAAEYTGVSLNKFLAEVDAGFWPKPETRGGRKIWDRQEIDEVWDRRRETEGESDPFMDALNDR